MIISIISSSKIGSWNIPQRGQNFINNYYAINNNMKIELNTSEELFFNNFNMLKKMIKNYQKDKLQIIFCSSLQLTNVLDEKEFINFFKNFKLHFALELKSGKGAIFLKKIFLEVKNFSNKERIDINNFKSYDDLFKKYKNKII